GSAVDIGEVATTAPGDEYFAARLRIVLEEEDSPIALTGGFGAHEAGRTATDNKDPEISRPDRHCIDCRRLRGERGVALRLALFCSVYLLVDGRDAIGSLDQAQLLRCPDEMNGVDSAALLKK